MSITTTCCVCGTRQPIEAGLLEDDAKRLAAVLGDMQPALARTALNYLRLFKPPKTELRIARAAKILRELQDLVATGTVTRDERSAMFRPASPALWAQGIERMLAAPPSDQMENHNYLRKVVFGLADQADAIQERQRDVDLRTRQTPSGVSPAVKFEDKLQTTLAWLAQQLEYNQLTPDEYEVAVAEAKAART